MLGLMQYILSMPNSLLSGLLYPSSIPRLKKSIGLMPFRVGDASLAHEPISHKCPVSSEKLPRFCSPAFLNASADSIQASSILSSSLFITCLGHVSVDPCDHSITGIFIIGCTIMGILHHIHSCLF